MISLLIGSNSTGGFALGLKFLTRDLVDLNFTFLLVPCGWTSADDLHKDRISLYSISYETQAAYLVEFDNGLEQYNTRKHPILHNSLWNLARNFYVVPLDIFSSFTNKPGTMSLYLVWMTHVSLCGSVVWPQIFNDLPQWEVISEPHFLMNTMARDCAHLDMETMTSSKEVIEMAVSGFKYQVSVFPPNALRHFRNWRAY